MRPSSWRPFTALVFVALSAACGENRVASPLPVTKADSTPALVPPVYPAPAANARTFNFLAPNGYAVRAFTSGSQFVLYNDSTFALIYPGSTGAYRGRYHESASGTISFEWNGSAAWAAIGTLTGDLLYVKYDAWTELSDFENAVYRRVQ